ncbi:MAG: hypothetical protein QOF35_215, partial [Actinomycetota bacterium]|nr:hypothetical protein [Actinomycetota bacterium]
DTPSRTSTEVRLGDDQVQVLSSGARASGRRVTLFDGAP